MGHYLYINYVIGNVDSGSSDQQESSVPATPVDSALGSQDGPS